MAAFTALVTASSSSSAGKAVVTVRVDARDFSFALSRRSAPAGSKVRFVVRNRGTAIHDFVVKGRRTRKLGPGKAQTITVAFPKRGSFRFLCSVAGHARLGMRGTFTVGRASAPAPAPDPPPPVTVAGTTQLTTIGSFDQPVFVTAPEGDPRVFVVEQPGTVRIVRDGTLSPEPFLDLRDRVTMRGESGLLSIAFSPDYATNGLVYAFYNVRQGEYGDIRISEFRRSEGDANALDPASERGLVTIPKPYENHNGGMLQFGPDGYLYASVGDGDPGALHPAGFFAQRLDSLLGTVLRIDPAAGTPYGIPADNPFLGNQGARPEIWAYGLRNPWRFWIDADTRQLIIGDVGSTSREEVDVVGIDDPGANFGWPCFEGSLEFDASAVCDRPVGPALEIPRTGDVCAIIGGVVVRDPRLPALAGRYLYGDLCAGTIAALLVEDGSAGSPDDLGLVVPGLTSFGVDGSRRVYATSAGGSVYRLDPRTGG